MAFLQALQGEAAGRQRLKLEFRKLRNGGFERIVGTGHEDDVRREVFLGESKLDFLVGNVFLEVKTPLQHLQVDVPEWVRSKKVTPEKVELDRCFPITV